MPAKKRSRTLAHVSIQVVGKDVKRVTFSDDGQRVRLEAGPHEVILDVELLNRIAVAMRFTKDQE